MTMNKILLILLITILSFVITVLIYNALGIQVQDSLINMFLGACTTELATMGGIKIFKVKSEKSKNLKQQILDKLEREMEEK